MTARPVHRLCRWMILFALSAVVIGFTRYSMLAQGPVPVGSSDPRSTQKGHLSSNPPDFLQIPFSMSFLSIPITLTTLPAPIFIPTPNRGHFIAINATLMQLLEYAYAIPDSRIIGAPAWTKSAKYDIEGKSDPEFAEKQAAVALQRGQASIAEDGADASR